MREALPVAEIDRIWAFRVVRREGQEHHREQRCDSNAADDRAGLHHSSHRSTQVAQQHVVDRTNSLEDRVGRNVVQ